MEQRGATLRKRFGRFKPLNRLNKANLFVTGCHRLPRMSHGKEGVSGSGPEEGSKDVIHLPNGRVIR